MSKILVTKAVKTQYPVGAGAPILVLGGGRGGQARGRTLRERAGGFLGGTVGVLGALAGQHRSLGGLAQSMISGGAQGAGLGAGLARKVAVGRRGQAKADFNEQIRNQYAQARAEGRLPPIKGYAFPSLSMQRQAVTDLNIREAAAQEAEKQRRAEEIAAAKARGTQFGTRQQEDAKAMAAFREQTGLDPSVAAGQFMGPLGAAISQRQGQAGGVDAANNQVQVIGPGMHPNMLPAPLTVPTVGQTIGNEEQNPPLTNDNLDHDGEYQTYGLEGQQVESPEQRAAVEQQMGAEAMRRLQQQQQRQPQGNKRSIQLDIYGNPVEE